MAGANILLDSNAYFRLARSIHPLLNQEFGNTTQYCLYVIADLEKEFGRSRRLRNKFSWVDDQEYRDNRSFKIPISQEERKQLIKSSITLLTTPAQKA